MRLVYATIYVMRIVFCLLAIASTLLQALSADVSAVASESNGVTHCTARTLKEQWLRQECIGRPFRITGTVLTVLETTNRRVTLEDKTGTVLLSYAIDDTTPDIHSGDRITASGSVEYSKNRLWLRFDRFTVEARGSPPVPHDLSVAEFREGLFDQRLIRIIGVLREVVRDELDPEWITLLFYDHGQAFHATAIHREDIEPFERLIGVRVAVTGQSMITQEGQRKRERSICFQGLSGLKPTEPVPEDPFDRPDIAELASLPATSIFAVGRHRTQGRVLATWGGASALLRADKTHALVKLDISRGGLPAWGCRIEAEGLPEPDPSRINLTHVRWRQLEPSAPEDDPVLRLSAGDVLSDACGRQRINTEHHGKTIRLQGTVSAISPRERDMGILGLISDGFLIPMDCSSDPSLLSNVEDGSTVEATGICVIDVRKWEPGASCPKVDGLRIIPRCAADIVVLSRPPWWTPTRLALVIAVLLLVLGGICAWNVSLRRLAERRGREIAAIDIARAEATLKTHERTRLAVELHDSIAQNLTGAVMELKAAHILAQEDPQSAMDHVSLATKTLDSCRDDLRNCIWDLRNQTLEEICLDEAIRKTVLPHIADTELNIRFNVPRTRLSDNTTHDILRIIRELCINAVRHGNATAIRIAGCLDGDRLLFSVADNGCGFDPAHAPGIVQGHFGLQGIRDRTKAFDGTMHVESRLGAGTKVTITLCLPPPKSGTPS